jgi:WD40 repeat protein
MLGNSSSVIKSASQRLYKLDISSHPFPTSHPIPSMNQYVLKKTIRKHHDSINALAFSLDGSLFASGADDGLIIVFQGDGSGKEIRRFQVKAPITTLLWRSRFGYTVIAGDTSGDVHTICLDGSATVSISYQYTWSTLECSVHRGIRTIIPSTLCLVPFIALHRVMPGWLSAQETLCSWLSKLRLVRLNIS